MPEELLKTTEVAALLRVHPKQVYRLMRKGLPARRVGSEWRFARDEVLAWSGADAEVASTPVAAERSDGPPPLLAANGDLVIEVLLASIVAEKRPLIGFVQADRGVALSHLAARSILLAGFHGETPPSHLQTSRLARIHLVDRAVGLASRARLRSVADLEGKRLASRPGTAGVRAHLEAALARAKTTTKELGARTESYDSHREAVCAAVRGDADVALTTQAWASRVGLKFLPLAKESYDLLLFAEDLGRPHVVGICEIAQSKAFRTALARVPGYDASTAGEIRYEFA